MEEENQQQENSINPVEEQPTEAPKSKKGLIITMVIIGVIVIGGGAFAAYYFELLPFTQDSTKAIYQQNNSENEDTDNVVTEIEEVMVGEVNKSQKLFSISEKLVGGNYNLTLSKDGKRVMIVGQNIEGKFIIGINEEVNEYDLLTMTPVFDSSLNNIAYTIKNGIQTQVVLNGKEGKSYDNVESIAVNNQFTSLVFSSDGKLALLVIENNKQFVVVDGKARTKYDITRNTRAINEPSYLTGRKGITPVFSPDGNKLAYTAQQNDRQFVILEDLLTGSETKGEIYDSIDSDIVFSPDSKRFAYRASNNGKEFFVVNGKEDQQFNRGTRAWVGVFSEDSKHFTYIMDEFVILDNEIIGEHPKPEGRPAGSGLINIQTTPIFSPDSTKLAYIADKHVLLHDTEGSLLFEGDEFFRITKLTFLLDNTLLYTAEDSPQAPTYERIGYIIKGTQKISIGGEEANIFLNNSKDDYVTIGTKLSNQGLSYSYSYKGKTQIINGTALLVPKPFFTPNDDAVAFIIFDQTPLKGQVYISMGNQNTEKYDSLSNVRFTDDGKFLQFVSLKNNEVWLIVYEILPSGELRLIE